MTSQSPAALQAAAWQKLCHHCDGLAIGSTVAVLAETGILTALASASEPISVDELAARYGLARGRMHLAARLLALQGLARRSGALQTGDADMVLTPVGRAWMESGDRYRMVPESLAFAASVEAAVAGASDLMPLPTLPDPGDGDDLARRVAFHLWGPVIAALMAAAARNSLFQAFGANADRTVSLTTLPVRHDTGTLLFDCLAMQGWAWRAGDAVGLTPEGAVAVAMAPQYFYPVSYLATMAAVPTLLRGGSARALVRDSDGTETHVDRALDVQFSGLVFQRTCRDPFLEAALPLFDDPDLSGQPRAVVDCGAGDGTLLKVLYAAIAERTRRGAVLSEHPLTMVAAEYNCEALEIAGALLQKAGVPCLTLEGDIADPAALTATLGGRGFAPDEVLHVSKSVIHNRCYQGAATPVPDPLSRSVFVAPDGDLIAAGALEADLVACFDAWRGQLGRHGMIVIEAHTVDEALPAARVGANLVTGLEASHGYSHQYLVEIDVHRRAAVRAGLRLGFSRDLGSAMVGAPIMSVDHYFAG